MLTNQRYGWRDPEARRMIVETLAAPEPVTELEKAIELTSHDAPVILTMVTREYLHLGQSWCGAIGRLQVPNVVLVCGDEESRADFAGRGARTVLAPVSTPPADEAANFVGFSPKAVALTALKFAACRTCLQRGRDVIFSDIDALWLTDPRPYLGALDSDVAFQRVFGFPAEVVRSWGFAACSGFFWLRSCEGTLALCDRMCAYTAEIADDQVVLNLALAEAGVRWSEPADWSSLRDLGARRLLAGEGSGQLLGADISGRTRELDLRVTGLGQRLFYRHRELGFDPLEALILHPNSPKDESAKMDVFRELGVELSAESLRRGPAE
jgi:hypothetical protein